MKLFGVIPIQSTQKPSLPAAIAAAVFGVLAVLNQSTVHFGGQWHAYFTAALVFAAGLGIVPAIGPSFRNLINLPHWLLAVITSGLAAVQVALTTVNMSGGLHDVIVFVVTALAGLGFGTVATSPAPPIPVVPPVKS